MKRQKVIKNVLKYSLSYKSTIVLMTILVLFALLLSQAVPYLQGIIASFVKGGLENETIRIGLIILGILLISGICTFFQDTFMYKLGYDIAKDMRKDVFKEILNKPYEFFEVKPIGEIVLKATTYVNDMGNYISNDFIPLIVNALRIWTILVFLFLVNYVIGIYVLALLILAFTIMLLLSSKMRKLSAKYKNTEMMRNSLVLESIDGLDTLIAYNQENKFLHGFNKVSKNHRKRRLKFYAMHTSFVPLMEMLWHFSMIVIYIVSFLLIENNYIEIGIIVSAFSFMTQIVTPLSEITMSLNGFAKVFGTADKVYEVFSDGYYSHNGKKELGASEELSLKLENVSFNHKVKGIVLKDINFEVKPKEKILIRGKYGSGKSSLALLCAGLYDETQGKILINNQRMKDINKSSLAKHIGLLNDSVSIYDASIFDNIKMAKNDATEKEIFDAAYLASLNKWFDALDGGIYTNISNKEISSGDRQLLGFARIILQNPEIIIIDEVARNLDNRARKRFYKALNEFSKDKTLIYISSFDKPNIHFDSEYIMEDGKLSRREIDKDDLDK